MKTNLITVSVMCMLLLVLCGCQSPFKDVYVSVTPHDETYQVSETSDVITVNNQLSLKNAMLNYIMECTPEIVIHAESYTDDMPASISHVAYEIAQQNPIGVFAIESMTYEYSKILNYYEITFHVIYRQDRDVLSSVEYISDVDSIRGLITQAMFEFQDALVLNIGNYEPVDINELIRNTFNDNADRLLCCPEVTVSEYPESGPQRVVAIRFQYPESRDACSEKANRATELIQAAVERNASNEDQVSVAKRLYYYLCRNADTINVADEKHPYADSAYGVLAEKCGTPAGFAMTYQKLLLANGINSTVVYGSLNGYRVAWCRVAINDSVFYVDPGTSAKNNDMTLFEISPLQLLDMGYSL